MRQLLLLPILILSLAVPTNAYSYDKPQIDAYAINKLLPAGQTTQLQITIVNSARYKVVEKGDIEDELYHNVSLNAYNLSVWLEGDEIIKVKSGRIRVPILHPASERIITFVLYIPLNATGEHTLQLHVKYERVRFVSVSGNLSSNYEIYYSYETVEKTIPIEIEVTQAISPKLKVFPTRSTLYGGEINQLTIQIANEGSYAIRNVEVIINGDFDILDPKAVYVPSIQASGAVPATFTVKAREGIHTVKVEIRYQYFDGVKWINTSKEDEFQILFKPISSGIKISLSQTEFERGQKGIVHLFVMNMLSNPVSITIQLKEPEDVDFNPDTLLAGLLAPGEVRDLKISYDIDENAKFGNRTLLVNVNAKFMNYPDLESFDTEIPLIVKPVPDFSASCNKTLYVGEDNQILKINLTNVGGDANDVHAILIPSPGIVVKDPEAYVESLKNGQTATLMYKVDVDEDVIPNKIYRLELKLTSKDYKGDEYSETVYVYVKMSEKSMKIHYIALACIIVVLVIVGILKVKAKRKRTSL
jgi:hypothetical protein